MDYYFIKLMYENTLPLRRIRLSAHIIQAKSIEDALRIQQKYGIAFPMGSTDILHIKCKRLNMRYKDNQELICRRLKGIGGNIWYEENNELKYITNGIQNNQTNQN